MEFGSHSHSRISGSRKSPPTCRPQRPRQIEITLVADALMGLFYLKLLDEGVERAGLAYARFMDDWVILAPTRWKLRAAIRLVNHTLAELKLQQHPDKTFIGRVSRGFDFLGYQFTPGGAGSRPAGGGALRGTCVPAL